MLLYPRLPRIEQVLHTESSSFPESAPSCLGLVISCLCVLPFLFLLLFPLPLHTHFPDCLLHRLLCHEFKIPGYDTLFLPQAHLFTFFVLFDSLSLFKDK